MELAKGVRDYPPRIQRIREKLFLITTTVFQKYGFSPFATPIIEREDTLLHKFTGEEDVMNELFRLSDQGQRKLGLRFDLTVPLCRYVAMTKDLRFPFKRYEIGRVYRDGPIKLGRYREFWQCDADIIGSPSPLADAECIQIACEILRELPLKFEVRVNNRVLLNELLADINDKERTITILDKLHKIGEKGVLKQLKEFLTEKEINHVKDILALAQEKDQLKAVANKYPKSEGVAQLQKVMKYLGTEARVELTLARGLNYYTGTVFEAFLLDSEITSSVSGGGRYDEIIGSMRGAEDIPAVGVSIGVEPLTDALIQANFESDTTTQVLIVSMGADDHAAQVAATLRARGVATQQDLMGRSLSKNLSYANKENIPLLLIVGQRDIEQGHLTLKHMKTGEESQLPLDLEGFNVESYL